MDAIKTLRLVHLFAYLLVTSQLLFYLFLMGDALKLVRMDSFAEQRQVVHRFIEQRHVPVYWACLGLSLAVAVTFLVKDWRSPQFLLALIALLCLLADVALAQKEIHSINVSFQAYAPDVTGTDWEGLRQQWVSLVKTRGIFSTVGFLSLVAGLVWSK